MKRLRMCPEMKLADIPSCISKVPCQTGHVTGYVLQTYPIDTTEQQRNGQHKRQEAKENGATKLNQL